MRLSAVVAAVSLSVIGLAVADDVRASIRKPTNIPAQPLGPALQTLAKDRNFQVVYVSEEINSAHTHGAVGEFTSEEALKALLSGTGLTFRYLDEKTVTVVPVSSGTSAAPSSDETALPRAAREDSSVARNDAEKGGQNRSFWDRFRVAQVDQGSSSSSAAVEKKNEQASEKKPIQLEEVIVTAQKREERLMDVPASVSTISGERLALLQADTLSDVANFIPGLAVTSSGGPGMRQIVIRGVSTDFYPITTAPTVATYVDDMPVGSGAGGPNQGSVFGLDLNPYDIERLEVLKGPQGTLYGSNAMGGLVKYVLRAPNLTKFEASMGGDLQDVDGSGRPSSVVRGSINVPIVADKLALRVSGFYNNNAGYIDNFGLSVKHANHSTEDGGRATLLWQATDRLAFRVNVLAQDVDGADLSVITLDGTTLKPVYGSHAFNLDLRQPYTQKTRVYNVHADWDLGFATLISSTGWSRLTTARSLDFSTSFGQFCAPASFTTGCPDYPFANARARFDLTLPSRRFVQEVRLASPVDQRIQWMLGGYYTKEEDELSQNVGAFTPSLLQLPVADTIFHNDNFGTPSIFRENAVFGNATYRFSDQFDISGGIRHSTYSEVAVFGTVYGALFGGVTSFMSGTRTPSTGVTTWMTDARFRPSRDMTIYARVATGYRPGSGCPTCGIPSLNIPGIVEPDRTTNYEVGLKGQFLDNRLQIDLSAFQINWSNIQLNQLSKANTIYAGNGGTARIRGLELAGGYRILESLQFNATLAYTDARLTQDALGANGLNGDQLPASPRWTGSLGADYGQPLRTDMSFLLGGAYRYRDKVLGLFEHAPNSYPAGPQNIVDMYTGFAVKNLTVKLHARNIFNNKSYTGLLYLDNPQRPLFVPIQPRTIGLGADYQF
jgi:outer membrane receptor protein involved in Fe transport